MAVDVETTSKDNLDGPSGVTRRNLSAKLSPEALAGLDSLVKRLGFPNRTVLLEQLGREEIRLCAGCEQQQQGKTAFPETHVLHEQLIEEQTAAIVAMGGTPEIIRYGMQTFLARLMSLTSAERNSLKHLLAGQKSVLRLVAAGQPLAQTLSSLVETIERQAPGVLCAVLLLDKTGNSLHFAAANSLPVAFIASLDGLLVASDRTAYDFALYLKEQIVIPDITCDPRWNDWGYGVVALEQGLRSCFSTPILASTGEALGLFAMLRCEVHTPNTQESNLIEMASQMAGIAIELNRAEEHRLATERNRQLEIQMEEMQKVNQLKDEFLSTVSHELRTPLANMKLAIHMLESKLLSEREQRYLSILTEECERETELINDLLDMQRLDAGYTLLNPEPIVLQEWLPICLRSFGSQAEARQQSLKLDASLQMQPLVTDRRSLERVVVELVNNACKYSPPGGYIFLQATQTASLHELAVTNNGPAIPATELPHLFEKFYRVPGRDLWHQGGTGLGLSLVEKLVNRLGGKISVSSLGNLTTFRVLLPQLS